MIEYQFEPAGEIGEAFRKLYDIIAMLRSPDGCPYDRAQTERSSLGNLVDEAYEYLEGIVKSDTAVCKEEIGDCLLNVFSILQIHADKNDFDPVDAVNDVCEKLIRRHPHVFGSATAENTEEALSSWNKAKEMEHSDNSITAKLDHIPSSMPPLEKAFELSRKIAKTGFEYSNIDDVIDKIYEELDEVKEAIGKENLDNIEDEIGDLFMTILTLCRWTKVRPDQALARAAGKFRDRFDRLCVKAEERGIPLSEVDLDLWKEVKEEEA